MNKQIKSLEFKADSVDLDERTFSGYAATWDLDKVGDIIHKGAFQKSINEAFPNKKIKVLYNHGDPIGMPIEMREDEKGLFVKGKVSKTRLGDEVLELMKDGVIDKMSIGYQSIEGKRYFQNGVRHLTEVKLSEFSPVTNPANDEAVITQVKNMLESNSISQELKNILTESIGTLNVDQEPSQDTQDEQKQFSEILNELKNESNDMSVWAITKELGK